MPAGLDLSLASASFTFDSAAPSFVIALTTRHFGSGAFVAGKDSAGNWGYVFGAAPRIPFALDIADLLPLGSPPAPGGATLAIEELQLVGASQALPPLPEDPQLRSLLGDDVRSGLALAVAVRIGNVYRGRLAVRFGGPDDGAAADTPRPR